MLGRTKQNKAVRHHVAKRRVANKAKKAPKKDVKIKTEAPTDSAVAATVKKAKTARKAGESAQALAAAAASILEVADSQLPLTTTTKKQKKNIIPPIDQQQQPKAAIKKTTSTNTPTTKRVKVAVQKSLQESAPAPTNPVLKQHADAAIAEIENALEKINAAQLKQTAGTVSTKGKDKRVKKQQYDSIAELNQNKDELPTEILFKELVKKVDPKHLQKFLLHGLAAFDTDGKNNLEDSTTADKRKDTTTTSKRKKLKSTSGGIAHSELEDQGDILSKLATTAAQSASGKDKLDDDIDDQGPPRRNIRKNKDSIDKDFEEFSMSDMSDYSSYSSSDMNTDSMYDTSDMTSEFTLSSEDGDYPEEQQQQIKSDNNLNTDAALKTKDQKDDKDGSDNKDGSTNDNKPSSNTNSESNNNGNNNNNSNNNGNNKNSPSGNATENAAKQQGPKFDQTAYLSLYAPNAATSPKLSSCPVVALPLAVRPLFPGLYYPVVIRDPLLVTEILKQVHSGFPFVSVFLKKGQGKGDIFDHHGTIPSVDKKHPPLPLKNNTKTKKNRKGFANPEDIPEGTTVIDSGTDPDNLFSIGTFAQIYNVTALSNGAIHVTLVGLRRVELQSVKYDVVPALETKNIIDFADYVIATSQSAEESINGEVVKQMKHLSPEEAAAAGLDPSSAAVQTPSMVLSHKQARGAQIQQQIVSTSLQQYPLINEDGTPAKLPENVKRVMIGNIHHFDEESPYMRQYDENGILKTPMEMLKSEELYKTYTAEILSAMRELLAQSTPGIAEQMSFFNNTLDLTNPGLIADVVATFTKASGEQLQQLLETVDLTKRLHLTLILIKRELELSYVHTEIQKNMEEHLQKTQREFYLKQQLQQIKKELNLERGDGMDNETSLLVQFKQRVRKRWDYIPQSTRVLLQDELNKLQSLETSSSEYNVVRNYVDWLTSLPWDYTTDEIYDIKRTEDILNSQHYGMQDVKDRILEFVAVGKLLQRKQQQQNQKQGLLGNNDNGMNKNNLLLQDNNTNKIIIDVENTTPTNTDSNNTDDKNNNNSTDIKKDTCINNDTQNKPSSADNYVQSQIIPVVKNRITQSKSSLDDKDGIMGNNDNNTSTTTKHHQATTGKILLFVGPPGVGKTSIGKSIAKSLNREFYRFSVGGLTDVSEIKGHRRTYVGALPGKIIQALKKTQCSNPVILIDEIDKIGQGGSRGDPSAALLELLDPEQNASFTDHYLDVPVDLSKVLFLCTANDLSTMPGPLRDRMDIVELSGYIQQEKEHIAENYLVPNIRQRCGLAPEEVEIELTTIAHLVRWYCREAGVRQLQKYLEMILRKVSFRVIRGDPLPIRVNIDNLSEYIGQELYQTDRLFARTPVGVVTGLAWSRAGGSAMYIESAVSNAVMDKAKMDKLNPKKNKKNVKTTVETETNNNNENGDDKKKDESDGAPIIIKDKKEGDKNKDGEDDDDGSRDVGSLKLTGSLGEVMKESASIAYTLSKIYLHKLYEEYQTEKLQQIKQREELQFIPTDDSKPSEDSIPNIDLGIQDDPIDPLNCKIPILRPPISNSTQFVSKIQSANFSRTSALAEQLKSVEQSTSDGVAAAKNTDYSGVMRGTIDALQNAEFEDDLLNNNEVTAIAQIDETDYKYNPQQALKPGDTYVTKYTANLSRQLLTVKEPNFFAQKQVHIHAPQGATPKDGPSAGIALVSVLLSQALNRPLVNNIAMTGEVSLTGKVLPIGGLREKIIGARQSNIFHILVPKANMHDIAELPEFITEGLTIYFVEHVEEVIRIVFGAPYALNGPDAPPTLIKKYNKKTD